jgi:hypothetical protein
VKEKGASALFFVDICFSLFYKVNVTNKETKMKTFKFTAYGKTFYAEAARGRDVMQEANKALIWNLSYKPGCWMENGATEFTWVEGNFFD